MNVIEVKGPIISNDDYWIYEWLDMEATCPKNVNKALKELNGEGVTVEINSPGGSVFAGSEIYTALKSYKGNVRVEIVGLAASAASAASVIAMAGDKVLMSPTAQIMIHNSSVSAAGDKNDMEHTSEILKGVDESISNAYKLKSGLTTEELLELMDNETWLTSKTALDMGLIDEVMFEDEAPQLVANVGGMIPGHVVNKLRNTLKKDKQDEDKLNKKLEEEISKKIEDELNKKLQEMDLKLTLRGL